MCALGMIHRVAIAACSAFALLAAVACQHTVAQPGLPIRNVQIDVAPLRASVGDPQRGQKKKKKKKKKKVRHYRINLPEPWRVE